MNIEDIIRRALCAIFCIMNFWWNGKHIAEAIKDKVTSEFFIHLGLTLFFGILFVELPLAKYELWYYLDDTWARLAGFLLYLPSLYLVVASWKELKEKGKPKDEPTCTTVLIKSGIYARVRQPMTLGTAIWSVALILVFQSVFSLVLGTLTIICMYISAIKESEYNIRKFGEPYKKYMEHVPMWNFLKTKKDV